MAQNARGQIDVWSDKCLPAGTVHLRLPRLPPLVQKLGFDFAPAMVGFDVKGGRAVPRFEGLVVCREHADVIMDVRGERLGGGGGGGSFLSLFRFRHMRRRSGCGRRSF